VDVWERFTASGHASDFMDSIRQIYDDKGRVIKVEFEWRYHMCNVSYGQYHRRGATMDLDLSALALESGNART
jgi:hypothetical protein